MASSTRFHAWSIRNQLAETRQFIDFLQKKNLQTVGQLTHGDLDAAWHHVQHNRSSIAGTVRNIQKFIDQTRGLPAVPSAPKTRMQNELELFSCYLKEIRGLVDTTIRAHPTYPLSAHETRYKQLIDGSVFSCGW